MRSNLDLHIAVVTDIFRGFTQLLAENIAQVTNAFIQTFCDSLQGNSRFTGITCYLDFV
jgi:hypothetical protein